eukprot:1363859-Alexandrium_andersonii.AAC.1
MASSAHPSDQRLSWNTLNEAHFLYAAGSTEMILKPRGLSREACSSLARKQARQWRRSSGHGEPCSINWKTGPG